MNEFFGLITAQVPAWVCLFLGIVLTGVEIFLPGFGIFGALGIILLCAGIFLAASTAIEALLIVLGVLVIIGVLVYIAIRSARKGRLAKSPLVLSAELGHEEGFSATEETARYLGKRGMTLTPLRPAGAAVIDGERLDVVSESAFIEQNVAVCVIKTDGRRIVVRPI